MQIIHFNFKWKLITEGIILSNGGTHFEEVNVVNYK